MIYRVPFVEGSFNGIFSMLRSQSNMFHIVANNLIVGIGTCAGTLFKSGHASYLADGDSTTAVFSKEGSGSSMIIIFTKHRIQLSGISLARPTACGFPRVMSIEGLNSEASWEEIALLNDINLPTGGSNSFSIESQKFYQQIRLRQISNSVNTNDFYLREAELFGSLVDCDDFIKEKSPIKSSYIFINIIITLNNTALL